MVTPIVGVCNCSVFCCTLLYVHSSIAIILMEKRELVALLNLSSWCLVMVERFFLAVPRGCLRFVIVVFPDHTLLLFLVLKNVKQFYYSCDACVAHVKNCKIYYNFMESYIFDVIYRHDAVEHLKLTFTRTCAPVICNCGRV